MKSTLKQRKLILNSFDNRNLIRKTSFDDALTCLDHQSNYGLLKVVKKKELGND